MNVYPCGGWWVSLGLEAGIDTGSFLPYPKSYSFHDTVEEGMV